MVENDSVICCIMKDNGNFILVEQYRPNLEKLTIEFPAGGVEKNERHLDAAHREIYEETGYSCDLLYLGAFRLLINRTTNLDHLYFGINPSKKSKDIVEPGIRVIELTRKMLINQINSGGYFQLAGIGIIQLIAWKLDVDLMKDNMNKIKNNFYNLK